MSGRRDYGRTHGRNARLGRPHAAGGRSRPGKRRLSRPAAAEPVKPVEPRACGTAASLGSTSPRPRRPEVLHHRLPRRRGAGSRRPHPRRTIATASTDRRPANTDSPRRRSTYPTPNSVHHRGTCPTRSSDRHRGTCPTRSSDHHRRTGLLVSTCRTPNSARRRNTGLLVSTCHHRSTASTGSTPSTATPSTATPSTATPNTASGAATSRSTSLASCRCGRCRSARCSMAASQRSASIRESCSDSPRCFLSSPSSSASASASR